MPLVQRHEGEIAGNEHQAGDPRADGRRGEPAIGLQQPVKNDREPVQQGLGSEHLQHFAGNGDHVGGTQCTFGLLGFSSAAIGPAAATMTMHSGTTMTTVQVNSAEVIWPTRAFSAGSRADCSAERASTGIIALLSAPPRISWYSSSGTWFAVTYAVPRQLAPTVCENTSVRTRPKTRDTS